MNSRLAAIAICAVVLGSGAAGYAFGSYRRLQTPATDSPEPRISAEEGDVLRRSREIPDDPMRAFERLLGGKVESNRIASIISRLPASEIPALVTRLREMIANPPEGADQALLKEIAAALYFRWAESDPSAAWRNVIQWPGEEWQRRPMVMSVLCAWMRSDGAGAYRAVKDNDRYQWIARDLFVRTWTKESLSANLGIFPEEKDHAALLGAYCAESAGDDAKRDDMIKTLREQTDMKHRDWAFQRLFGAWSYRNFEEAIQAAGDQGQPWLQGYLVDYNLGKNPGKALTWATNHGMELKPSWDESFGNWSALSPAEARKWLSSQLPALREQGKFESSANLLARELDKHPGSRVADLYAASLKELSGTWADWRAKDATAAERWLSTAAPAVKEAITGKGEAP